MVSTVEPIGEQAVESPQVFTTGQWLYFDGFIEAKTPHDAVLRSKATGGGAVLVKTGDYRQLPSGEIQVLVGAEVVIQEQPAVATGTKGSAECGPGGTACIGKTEVCCDDPNKFVGACEYEWRCPL